MATADQNDSSTLNNAGAPVEVASSDPAAGHLGQYGAAGEQWGLTESPSYAQVVHAVERMVGDRRVLEGASRRGLGVMNVMWEDTGRAEGSALGPNISDLTLQVRYQEDGAQRAALMPVIRHPNFTDKTADVRADRFLIRVGNHRGEELRSVQLRDVLRNVKAFASKPTSILGSGNLLAKRDSHFLVSAQAVFLPIPKQGEATFNPAVFNYQSAPGSPAVLTLLVTRQGTSMTVIDNRAEEISAAGWGQELYFNNDGQRTDFTAERLSDVERRIEAEGGPKNADDRSALAKGADVLFLVQVPLKHEQRGYLGGLPKPKKSAPPPAMSPAPVYELDVEESDVEQAVLGHGEDLGPFQEGNGLRLVRDHRFPVRITVQFYKATSNGVVSDSDLSGIERSIRDVYEHADYVGSLVIPEDDPKRPTAWQTMPGEWFPW